MAKICHNSGKQALPPQLKAMAMAHVGGSPAFEMMDERRSVLNNETLAAITAPGVTPVR